MRILVAGATGVLGREILSATRGEGRTLRTLSRRRRPAAAGLEVVIGDVLRPESLRGACDGIDVVISAIGASLDLGDVRDRRSFGRVDYAGNLALLREAERAGVRRFVYVSVFAPPELGRLEYVAAHERFADALTGSRLEHAVIRPTGFHSFFAGMLLLALRTVGRPGSPRSVPPWVLRAAAGALRPLNPRLSALLRFAVEVSITDAVAPARGMRRLGDSLAAAEPRRAA